MKIIITINNEDEAALLTSMAAENALTVEVYSSNIVSGWLKGRIKNAYIGYVTKIDIPTLKEKLGVHTALSIKEV